MANNQGKPDNEYPFVWWDEVNNDRFQEDGLVTKKLIIRD